MTIVHIVKCKNGYIAILQDKNEAHVFTEFADLVDFLYTLFDTSLEKIPA